MTGVHVEEPALHFNLPSPHSFFSPVGHEHAMFFPHPKQEAEFEGKLQLPTQIPSSLQSNSIKASSPLAGERHSWPECIYGGLFHPSTEVNTLGIHALQNMVSPAAEKKQNHDEYVYRGKPHTAATEENLGQGDKAASGLSRGVLKIACRGRLNGYVDGRVDHHTCPAQASVPAPISGVNVDHVVGFKGFVNNGAEYLSTFQNPTFVQTKGSSHLDRFADHMGKRGNFVNDLEASLEALTCESPPGDSPFWRFLPSNNEKHSMDLTSCDEFCMYEFKVRRCMRGRSHDWTECPYAHPGEKARRRDPRCFNYSGTACPDFRRGTCRKGDSCELSHGVFESWLHPARFRTQLCKDGKACKRRVCFFAHSPSQLRLSSPESLNSDQFSVKVPLATDAMAGYFEAPFKQPLLYQTATLRPGATNRYCGTGFFNDLGPKSMASFPSDGLQNTMSPMSALRHSLEHSKRASLERDLENCTNYNSYGHQNLAFEDLSAQFELNNDQDHSHGYYPVPNGLFFADNHGFESNPGCHINSPHSCPLDKSSPKADTNFRSQLAMANLKVSLDQLMSPTSTLVGHVFSPPPLSPPLSPTESPPMSPNTTPSGWNTALSRKISSLVSHPLPYDAFMKSSTSGVDSPHVSAHPHVPSNNYGLSGHAIMHGPSPLSITRNGDQVYDNDRLNAMQSAINIEKKSVQTLSMETNEPVDDMDRLVSLLQQLELKRAAMADIKNRKRCPSLLQRMQSPKARLQGRHGESWCGHGLPSHQGYESEHGLGGEHIGNLPKEEMENPDFGWVNELVN
ncbi:hypothetical protein L7F22_008012 [Adiantum nelumboides]|nr:hypothetical protein [Adiantum nelumboides]